MLVIPVDDVTFLNEKPPNPLLPPPNPLLLPPPNPLLLTPAACAVDDVTLPAVSVSCTGDVTTPNSSSGDGVLVSKVAKQRKT